MCIMEPPQNNSCVKYQDQGTRPSIIEKRFKYIFFLIQFIKLRIFIVCYTNHKITCLLQISAITSQAHQILINNYGLDLIKDSSFYSYKFLFEGRFKRKKYERFTFKKGIINNNIHRINLEIYSQKFRLILKNANLTRYSGFFYDLNFNELVLYSYTFSCKIIIRFEFKIYFLHDNIFFKIL